MTGNLVEQAAAALHLDDDDDVDVDNSSSRSRSTNQQPHASSSAFYEGDSSSSSTSWVWVDHHKGMMTTSMEGMTVNLSEDGRSLTTRHVRDVDRWVGPMPSLHPSSSLGMLRNIELVDCRYMTQLDDSLIQNVPHLQSLILKRCPLMERLPADWSRLQALEKIEITDLPLLATLPETLHTLNSLERLIVCGTSGNPNKVMKHLPAELPPNLCELVLDQCKALQSLPASIGRLTKLERLVLRQAKALQALPESIGQCTKLRELNLLKCLALKSLPSSVRHLPLLEDLILTKCKSLVYLWPEVDEPHATVSTTTSVLPRLATLDVQQCKSLQYLPHLAALRVFRCNQCPALTNIPPFHEHMLMWDIRDCPAATTMMQQPPHGLQYSSYPVLYQDKPAYANMKGRKRASSSSSSEEEDDDQLSQEESATKTIKMKTLG